MFVSEQKAWPSLWLDLQQEVVGERDNRDKLGSKQVNIIQL